MSCPLCKSVRLLKEFVKSLKRKNPDTEKFKEFVRSVSVFTVKDKTYVVMSDLEGMESCTKHNTYDGFMKGVTYLNQPEVLELIFAGPHSQSH